MSMDGGDYLLSGNSRVRLPLKDRPRRVLKPEQTASPLLTPKSCLLSASGSGKRAAVVRLRLVLSLRGRTYR
ncbi:hypothetical protein EVAR_97719_1 [Eumeta japonica]|uniref:Uncharacterized protein n=1 Tax=Eumeta variegata TaxID=151549 RepID=A0A4C1XWL9_EUMVA|nr:hypothetical protein EVAR_97719_1 [Eumeta japonica]